MANHRIIETSEHRLVLLPAGHDDNVVIYKPILFLNNSERLCIEPFRDNDKPNLRTSYYVGVDWLTKNDTAIYVAPKFEGENLKTNYLGMLLSCLKHTEVIDHTDELYDIKFDEPFIEIEQDKDLLTPLLAIQFLSVVKTIVKKGLKKSYYKIEQNLSSKIKGRPWVNKTITKNLSRGNISKTFCSYDEFGINTPENRLIKKTLLYVGRYLASLRNKSIIEATNPIFSFVTPSFENVSDDVDASKIKHFKASGFFKEYTKAIQLSLLILKRYGYNITSIQDTRRVTIPPFWIDMAKLFELYALGLLKDVFGDGVHYHYKRKGNELDYLLNSTNPEYKMVVDAKYKKIYSTSIDTADMRQLSGYARLESVSDNLKVPHDRVIDCLILYPTIRDGVDSIRELGSLKDIRIKEYTNFYKIGINLPLV